MIKAEGGVLKGVGRACNFRFRGAERALHLRG
jgi:hypothetical protein